MKTRRGSALVAVLVSLTIFAILGAALLQRQRLAYSEATHGKQGLQALALSQAGLEDARLKLEKDYRFPPPGDPSQTSFDYSETLLDWNGKVVGKYQVCIDRSHAREPHYIVRVESIGFVTSQSGENHRSGLVAEFDVSPTRRTNPAQVNEKKLSLLRVIPLATP